MALLKINGVPLKTPSTYDIITTTLVEGGRNSEGFYAGDIIREDMVKITVSWRVLTAEQWSEILKQFSTKYGGNFINEVEYLDQVTNTLQTRKFYVSDRKTSIRFISESGVVHYETPSLDFVEV